MKYGVCNLSLIPQRAEPSDKSEMTNQLLFGDHFQVLDENDKWAFIRLGYDFYEGWIDKKQFAEVGLDEYKSWDGLNYVLPPEIVIPAENLKTHEIHQLLAGTGINDFQNNQFNLGVQLFELPFAISKPELSEFAERVEAVARFYLNAPYLWGGRSLFGIDCSGFTQIVFKQFGIRLKRDAWQQAEQGEPVGFLEEAKLGDLAFFDNDEGRVVHVGIMLSNSSIIHASGKVRIDGIDNQEIFNRELGKHTHKLRLVKRYLL